MPRCSACRSRCAASCRSIAPAARPTSPAVSSPAGRSRRSPAPAPRRQPGRRALATVPVFAVQDYLQAIARSQNWPVLAILPPYIVRQGLVGAAMVAAVAFGAPAEPAVAVGCTLIATAAAVIVQGLALLRRLDPALLSGNRRYRPREWAAATLPMGFADLTLILFNSIDVLVLSLCRRTRSASISPRPASCSSCSSPNTPPPPRPRRASRRRRRAATTRRCARSSAARCG